MAKKKVAAVVKIQIPAGQATPAPAGRHGARPARRGDHGLLQGVQRADRGPAGHDRPVEITVFEDRIFTFVIKTPPTPVLLREAARLDKGARPRAASRSARSPRRRSRRSPRSSCPTSTPTTSRRPSSRWPAPPAPWASRSSDRPEAARSTPARDDLARAAVTRRQ